MLTISKLLNNAPMNLNQDPQEVDVHLVPLLLLFHLPVDLCPTTLSRHTSLGTRERVNDTAINES